MQWCRSHAHEAGPASRPLSQTGKVFNSLGVLSSIQHQPAFTTSRHPVAPRIPGTKSRAVVPCTTELERHWELLSLPW